MGMEPSPSNWRNQAGANLPAASWVFLRALIASETVLPAVHDQLVQYQPSSFRDGPGSRPGLTLCDARSWYAPADLLLSQLADGS